MLAEGDRVPDVTVWTAPNEQAKLPEVLAGAPALVFFYLFDFSGTCKNEFEHLRDRNAELDEAGVRAFGISRDSPYTHIAWSQALDLSVPLLSDWHGDAAREFGVAFEFRGLRDVAGRSAFLVDADGTVRGAWRYEPSEVPDLDVLLDAARALQPSS
jgi:peroxiredoxin (alkyl hydroperoxide reductase subunit C)